MIFFIFLVLGLIVGSFLNSVVYRLEVVETLWGRSHCPKCKARVRWFDNVPLLSFLVLGGKCRDCEDKISLQYPLIEFLTGILFAIIGHYFFVMEIPGTWLETLFFLAVSAMLMVILVYDFKFMEIPMVVLWLGVGTTLVYWVYSDWAGFEAGMSFWELRTLSGLIGGGVAWLFFFLMSYLSKERWMGYGDADVALLMGLILGWPLVLLALMLSFTIGALFGLALIALKRKTLQSQVPFAPFLVLGVFCVIILDKAYPLIKYYFLPFML